MVCLLWYQSCLENSYVYESSYNFCGPQVYLAFIDVSLRVVPLREQDVNPHFSLPHPVWQPLWRVRDTAVQTRSGPQSRCLLQTAKKPDVSLYAGSRVYVFTVVFTPVSHCFLFFFFQAKLESLCSLAQRLGFKGGYCIFLLLE